MLHYNQYQLLILIIATITILCNSSQSWCTNWILRAYYERKGGIISCKSTTHRVGGYSPRRHTWQQATLGVTLENLYKQSTTTFTLYIGCNLGSLRRDKRFSKTQIIRARWVEHAQFAYRTTIALIFTKHGMHYGLKTTSLCTSIPTTATLEGFTSQFP